MNRKKDFSSALLGIVVALILWVTLLDRERLVETPIIYQPFHAFGSFIEELQKGRIGANFLGNIVLFMPIGFLIPIVTEWNRMWKTVSVGLGISIMIETIQLITLRGCFDLDDVILNALGSILGFVLYCAAKKVFKRQS